MTISAFSSLGLLGSIWNSQLLYAIPLIVAVSLVYGATRDEQLGPILQNAFRAAMWIIVFMAIIFAVLWFAGRGL